MLRQLRRRAGMPKKSKAATTKPPLAAKNLFSGRSKAPLVAAVVVTVRVAVCEAAPDTLTDPGVNAHVAGSFAPLGPATEQARATLPVKPPEGVTVIVDVLPVAAPAASVRLVGLALRAKVGADALTVILTVAVSVMPPEVAVIFAT